jgi:hypothetical protein
MKTTILALGALAALAGPAHAAEPALDNTPIIDVTEIAKVYKDNELAAAGKCKTGKPIFIVGETRRVPGDASDSRFPGRTWRCQLCRCPP